jgi:poly(3-hydroxybutyrate) depolymerase
MRFALACMLAVTLAVAAHGQAGMTGRILDPVVCQADATQSYALYVPSSYTPQKKWPVIFCFDPGAHGRVPVERLQAAAEKYGYIVAGSLTSRNGPWAANAAAAGAMVLDVSTHLAIDPRRLYTAGLSGGARVATQLAVTGAAQGVIACSAGFPMPDQIPARVPFVFFGTTGTEDFNHAELQQLDEELEDRKAAHRIVVFNGTHEWAPAALLAEAVEWLELQAMRAGTRPRDEVLIQALLQARRAVVPAPPGVERWRALKSIAVDFKGLAPVDDDEKEAKALGTSRVVKDGLKAEHALARREAEQLDQLGEYAADGLSLPAMRKRAAEIRLAADATEDTPERRMARRVIASFAMKGRESTRALLDQHDYESAAGLLEVVAALRPGQARTLFDLARARAFNGDRTEALAALKAAAAAGYNDAARTEAEPAFTRLHGRPEFNDVLAAMRANPPEQDKK